MEVTDMAEPILTVEHLIKAYGETPVLDDISFAVKPGEVIVVVGPSGCGKSTLLRCLNGLEPTQSGRVRLGNETVAYGGKNLTQLRQRIGMVFQSYELFPHLTVLDNILLAPTTVQKRPKDEVQKEAEALLDRVGLLAKKNSYPRELSGGQKQRVAIVRALCMHPEILLFDEVTAALDPEMVREVLDVMPHHDHRHPRDAVCPRHCQPGHFPRWRQDRGRSRPGGLLRPPQDGARTALPAYLHV